MRLVAATEFLLVSISVWNLSGVSSFSIVPHASTCSSSGGRKCSVNNKALYMQGNGNNLHEFDHLLAEVRAEDMPAAQPAVVVRTSRRRIALTDHLDRTTILASSAATAISETDEAVAVTDADETEGAESSVVKEQYDPYGNVINNPQLDKIQQYQEQRDRPMDLEGRLKQMTLQDICATLIIPSIVVFAGARWVFNRASSRVSENADATLESFATEMIYHDGDFSEMELCSKDYSRRLMWMGPKKTDAMLKRYLEKYAKKKTVSPQAISSLSQVFSLFSLSEERAANLLVSLCRKMGSDKISSAGKLLFLGSRILKSDEGKAALTPIKDMIKATYRDATVAETLVETSQQAIAEAAYRTTVQAGGKGQKDLTSGWEVLGLDKATAKRIWDEEAKEGFVSAREAMYGGQTSRYDKKGRRVDKEGKLLNPAEADDDDDDSSDGPASNVYECSECGYTLFVAQGRESKFFGNDFKCPECGAPKEKFEARDDIDE